MSRSSIDHSNQGMLASSSCRRIAYAKVQLTLTILVVAICVRIAKYQLLSMSLNINLIVSDHYGLHGVQATEHMARYGLGETG